MKVKRSLNIRINRIAPVLSLLVLLVPAVVITNPGLSSAQIRTYHESVAAQLSGFPYRLGGWVGVDVALPAEENAVEPNMVVSRRYSRIGGSGSVNLGLIHCKDVRDMHAHRPPRAFQAGGWSRYETVTVPVSIEGQRAEMDVFRFRRVDRQGIEEYRTVASLFVLPEQGVITNLGELNQVASVSMRTTLLGVAQVRLEFDGRPGLEEVAELSTEFLGLLPEGTIRRIVDPTDLDQSSMPVEDGRETDQS